MTYRVLLAVGTAVALTASGAAAQSISQAANQSAPLKLEQPPPAARACAGLNTLHGAAAPKSPPRGVVMKMLESPMKTTVAGTTAVGGLLPTPNVAAQAGTLDWPYVGRSWLDAGARPFAYRLVRPGEVVQLGKPCPFD